ncbi:MAG: M20/M25/M40 family metallo-hydrolase, partial [Coprothermobacterota bacterium]|nr:M20/M25/M40 family metallo-hydrolase [Coprothermobacterota bacterium]
MSLLPLSSLLADLIAIPTANPPGGEEAIALHLQGKLADQGLTSTLYPYDEGRASLYAEIPGRQPGSLILTGHLDTVPPSPNWRFPPFQVSEEDGRLIGLGTADMKGGVAMLLEGFCQVARHSPPLYTLKLMLTADEEGDFGGAKSFQRTGLADDALFALVAEATGGRTMVGERGLFWPRLYFQGKEAHGSTPSQGINAIEAAGRTLTPLLEWARSLPPRMLFGPPTLNPGWIEGGRQPNIVAESCRLDLDFRYGQECEREALVDLMEELGHSSLPGIRFHWETKKAVRPLFTPLDDPWVIALRGAEAAEKSDAESPGVVSY